MGPDLTLGAAGLALFVLLIAARMQARRGIGPLSLVPWDYLMILSAILLLVAAFHLAVLWRDSQPL